MKDEGHIILWMVAIIMVTNVLGALFTIKRLRQKGFQTDNTAKRSFGHQIFEWSYLLNAVAAIASNGIFQAFKKDRREH